MIKYILLFGIVFFAFITIYNLLHSIRNKTSYLPSVFGSLVVIATVLIYFDRVLVVSFIFIIMLLLAIFSSKTIFNIRKRSLEKAMEGVEITSSFPARDIINIRYWGPYAFKNGPKKAALLYTLIQTVFLALILFLFTLIPSSHVQFHLWIPFLLMSFVLGLREANIVLREFCESKSDEVI